MNSYSEYKDIIGKAELFQGIEQTELVSMLNCLKARIVKYKRGKYLLIAGDKPGNIGIVLEGRLHVMREDRGGNRTLLSTLTASDIFAEALCCAGVEESPVSAAADSDVTVLQIYFDRILHTCPNSCLYHQKLIGNMLRLVAQKNLYLQNRIELLRTRSVRAKVTSYLNSFGEAGGDSFQIPLNREEMADYLCVERSALSHELMRMKREGLIDYRKNRFNILKRV